MPSPAPPPSPPSAQSRAFVVLVEFSPQGGTFQQALLQARALAELGYRVDVVTGSDPELTDGGPGVTVRPLLSTWGSGTTRSAGPRWLTDLRNSARYLRAWRRLNRYLRQHRPDIVQFADFRYAIDGSLAERVARGPHPPVLVDMAHNPWPMEERRTSGSLYKRRPGLNAGIRRAYAAMDTVFVMGERTRDKMLSTWPGVRRVEVVPHGNYLPLPTGPRDQLPAADAAGPVALFFGGWNRYKGLDLLLDAFALLRERLPEARLVLAGSVAADIDQEAITARARSIGGVELIPRYVPLPEVGTLMAGSRLVVAPYRVADQSGVVHMAFTFGRPVVATDVGDLGALVRTGETGTLVPPDDPEALADALTELLADPALARRLGEGARQLMDTTASWNAIGERIAGVYEELLAERQSTLTTAREKS